MTIKVLSNLDSFAFVDVVKLLKKNPSTFTAEFVLKQEVDDSIYYFTRLKKEFKKQSFIIALEDLFLQEFKEEFIRDYVFEKIIEFQLFRIENQIFTVSELVRTIPDFFEDLRNQVPQKARVQAITDPLVEDIDFIILRGSGDPTEILNLAKFG